MHDGTTEAEDLGRWWATRFGASVAAWQVPGLSAPVDAGDAGSDAPPLLQTLASAARAEVVWLHVVESATAGAHGYADPDPELRAFGRALQQLERLKLSLQRSSVASRAYVRPGSVAASVASVAKHSHVGPLAMSTYARTGTARTIHGSTARAIARIVAQPILWVHRR